MKAGLVLRTGSSNLWKEKFNSLEVNVHENLK
jgi:hypothetical protein